MFWHIFETQRNHETGRILGGPWEVSDLGQTLPDAIQRLPRVQDEERENLLNSSTKEAPETDHHHWI